MTTVNPDKSMPSGRELLRDPHYNRGTAFTAAERSKLGLEGLLPQAVLSLEEQAARSYEQYSTQATPLARNEFLAALHDRNEILYFKMLEEHVKELLPVVYDPEVAEAIEKYSHQFQRPSGVYLSVDDIDGITAAFDNYGLKGEDVDLLVATDAEEILGIGDWGANGMDISVGKLAVYTAAAGISPNRVIPVMLDVGTDRESLLNDPLYVGNRHSRVRGERYDKFIAAYVETARRVFPSALLHFEDFGSSNARRILNAYRSKAPVFNDDIEGTGAIVLAAALTGMRVSKTRPSEQRIVIFGGGTAGMGIADRLCDLMVRDGLHQQAARDRIWIVDLPGLLTSDMSGGLLDYQRSYVRSSEETAKWPRTTCQADLATEERWPQMAELRDVAAGGPGIIDLATTVAHVRPTILVGTSTSSGAFTEEIVRVMAKHVSRPMIFPISNPTERIEALPAELILWTKGRGLIATGLPWNPVVYKGTHYQIGQANNALIYPGIGLGAIVSRASRVTDNMLHIAAEAVAGQVEASQLGAGLLPDVENIRASSATVAVAVATQAAKDGVAQANLSDPVQAVQDAMWKAAYPDLHVSQ
jgi:malate dehydrogenase (oxaloacetate-decarboxylating)